MPSSDISVDTNDLHNKIVSLELQVFEGKQRNALLATEVDSLRNICKDAVKQKIDYQSLLEDQKLENDRHKLVATELTAANEQNEEIVLELREHVARYAIEVEQLIQVNLHLQSQLSKIEDKYSMEVEHLRTEKQKLRDEHDHVLGRTEQFSRIQSDKENLQRDNMSLHNDLEKLLTEKTESIQSEDMLKSRHTTSKEIIHHLDSRRNQLETENNAIKEKCFSSGRLINDLGVQTAQLKDQIRELSNCKTNNEVSINQLTEKNETLRIELSHVSTDRINTKSELLELQSTSSDLHCQIRSIIAQNEILRSIQTRQQSEIIEFEIARKKSDDKLIDKNCTIEAQLKRIDHLAQQAQHCTCIRTKIHTITKSSQTCEYQENLIRMKTELATKKGIIRVLQKTKSCLENGAAVDSGGRKTLQSKGTITDSCNSLMVRIYLNIDIVSSLNLLILIFVFRTCDSIESEHVN